MITTFTAMLSLCVLAGIIFIPVILKTLDGGRKAFILLQQTAIIAHNICLMMSHFVSNGQLLLAYEENVIHLFIRHCVKKFAIRFFLYFFYFNYYFMSFLHSFDFQVMVCHPLEYAEFRLAENLVVIVAKGMFVCLILATDQLVSLFVLLIPVTEDVLDSLQTILDILYYIEIFAVVKMVVMKAIYSVTIFKIAYMTKAGLENSCQVSGINDKKRQAMLKSIFYFSLIPFFLNILFVVHEALSINTNLIQGPGEGVLSDRMRQPDVQLTLTLVVFTIGSFSYYIGYWVLFPKLRNTLLCKSNDNQEIMT